MKKYDELPQSDICPQSLALILGDGVGITIPIPHTRRGKNGVYEIRNKVTGEFYIGQSRDLCVRRNQHMRKLCGGNHENFLLQNSVFKYGINSLEFRVILYCKPSELTFYESLLIKVFNPTLNRKV